MSSIRSGVDRAWMALERAVSGLRRRAADTAPGQRLAERGRERLIATSPWFDAEWYLEAHDDLVDVDPLTHFLLHGEREGRDPSADFDTPAYVWCNPGAEGTALTHFLTNAEPGQRPEHVVDMSRPVLAERWFEPAWYADRHPDLADDLVGLDATSATAIAWRHYRTCGGTPGPFFDREDFEIRNGVLATPEPLTAWDARRGGEVAPGRVPTFSSPDRRGPLVRPEILTREQLAQVKVAVTIHAFHLDLLDELLERVRWIPGRVSVFVTTNEIDQIGHIDERITAVVGDVPRAVRFTPNAGRNFGPLLAGLDHDLRANDVVLHLHTKKSLASGSEQREWRHHLLDGLLPSPAGAQAIVSALATDDAPDADFVDAIADRPARPIGLIHTTTWPGLPTFANHWLGNRGLGEQLFSALGLDPADASGWLDYPVGGMFWARTDTLVPLLDLTIQFAEFGEELGQTDRTLAHAIERVIPAAADVAGFDTVELDVPSGEWRLGHSDRNAERMGSFDADALASLDHELGEADVVSVDLFDTLLLRPTTDPDGLFDLLVDDLAAATSISSDEAARVVSARRSAEHRLRTAPDPAGDITLAEIEGAMVDAGTDASLARQLIDAELALEHRLAIPRIWLIERLRRLRAERPDVRIVLVTDTTQPAEAIDDLLVRIGADGIFHERYVSNDRRARKDHGTLWELVERAETPTRLLHLGDNPTSDLQQASDRGHHWFQTPAPGEVPAIGGVELRRIGPTGLDSRRRATEFLAGHGLASLAASAQASTSGTSWSADAFGYGVVGPMITAFARWSLEVAAEHGLEVLLFGGRDGHLVHEAALRLAPLLPDAPEPVYFPISRRMALGASLAAADGLATALDAAPWSGPLGGLAVARLGLDLPADLAATHVELPADRSQVIALLSDVDLSAHGRAEAAGLIAALDAAAGTDGTVGLVDLGYSGTILRSLRRVVERPIIGLFGASTAAIDDLADTHSCFTIDARVGHGDFIYDHAKVWEVLCSRVDDQAGSYRLDDGHVVLDTVVGTAPPADVAEVVERVQATALSFVDAHLDRFGPRWLAAPIDAPSVRRSFQVAVGRGVPDPSELFASLTMDDGFRNLDRIPLDAD